MPREGAFLCLVPTFVQSANILIGVSNYLKQTNKLFKRDLIDVYDLYRSWMEVNCIDNFLFKNKKGKFWDKINI